MSKHPSMNKEVQPYVDAVRIRRPFVVMQCCLTIHPSGSRFLARLNSGVMPLRC